MKYADQNVHADRHNCYRHMSNRFSHDLVAMRAIETKIHMYDI